jgi:hypothetical protein
MKMTCENVTDLLPELAAAAIDGDAAADLHAHIASCDACAAEWALVSSLRASLPPVPAALHARISNALAARPVSRRSSFSVGHLAIAASIVVALVGAPLAVLQITQSDDGVTTASTNDSLATSATASNTVSPAYVNAAPVLGGSSVLPELTEAQLEALLAKMGS